MFKKVRRGFTAFFVLVVASAAVLASGCSLVGGGDDPGSAGGATVRSVALSSEVDRQGVPVNPRVLFAPNVSEIRATVILTNVSAGMTVTGRWYQLGVANAGTEGQEINASDVLLDTQTAQNGNARVSFVQRAGTRGFPEDAWLLRVFVNGELVRTAGFVVSRSATATTNPGGTPTTNPTPGPQATAVATPAATSYTVQTGDTLATIAARFLSTNGQPNETAQAFATRIATFNGLTAGAVLQPQQVLRIPPAQ